MSGGLVRFELKSSFTRTGYLDAVARVREYIFAGDIFQANLSQRFEAVTDESAWSFYTRFVNGTPHLSPPFSTFPRSSS